MQELKNFLDDHKIDYTTVFGNYCLNYSDPEKRNYEIEYIESTKYPIAYPKFNIDGVDKDYFFTKSKEAEENNSFILWIKDFEWRDDRKREVLKSYILHAAGKTPFRFYARDCEVREVPTREGIDFELTNCFYGKRGASLRLGLYTKKEKFGIPKNTLLMSYSFGLNFFGKQKDIIEIIRVGTKRFHHVVGGTSKLIKHFINNYKTMKIGKRIVKPKLLKYYVDYCHNIGNSLESSGFVFDGYSKGGFMNLWLETGEIKHREPMRHKWVMNEMKEGRCLAIPNAGTKVYTMNINQD